MDPTISTVKTQLIAHLDKISSTESKSKHPRYEIIISNNSGKIDAIKCRVIDKANESAFNWLKRQINVKLKNVIQIKENKDTRILINVRSVAKHTGLKPKQVRDLVKGRFDKNFEAAISQSKILQEKSAQQYFTLIKNSPMKNSDMLVAYNKLPKEKRAQPNSYVSVIIFDHEEDDKRKVLLQFKDDPKDISSLTKAKVYNANIWNIEGRLYLDLNERYVNYNKPTDSSTWKGINAKADMLKELGKFVPEE